MIAGETRTQLNAALAALPRDARAALALAAEGFSGAEIATCIGRTELATRTLMCQGQAPASDLARGGGGGRPMNRHQAALTLAAAAIDFSLTARERATLDDHLAVCDSCAHTARALRSDAVAIASLPVPWLGASPAEDLLVRIVDAPAPGRPVFRLLVVMAVLTLLALGSLAVGAEMLRRAEQKDLSVVPPLPSPSVVADASPVVAPGIGLSSIAVTMPGWTVPDPGGATMNGVIAGGPGAIAWGWAYGLPGEVWTTADGIDWQPATIESPADADPEYKEQGEVTSITAWGSGYVAAGYYHRLETGRRSVIWTSTNGQAWTLLPARPHL